MRTQFPSGYQRERFVAQVVNPARDLAFRAARQSSNGMLVFALIEWQAASGTPTVVTPAGGVRPGDGTAAAGDPTADDAVELMLPSGPGVAVDPVPRLLLAPGQGEVLSEEHAAARTRYGEELRAPGLVQRWAEPADRPTIIWTFVDTGQGTFCNWRIDGVPGGVGAVGAEDLDRVLTRLAQGLPSVAAGVDKATSYRDLLTAGPFVDYDAEWELAVDLARTFLAVPLVDQLAAYHEAGVRPHLRVQPSPRTAAVPWELLAVDSSDVRLVEVADVTVVAPAGSGAGEAPPGTARRAQGRSGGLLHRLTRRRTGSGTGEESPRPATDPAGTGTHTEAAPSGGPGAPAGTGAIALVLDPRIPGWPASSALGSVLGRVSPGEPRGARLLQRLDGYVRAGRVSAPDGGDVTALFRRTHTDRDWLSAALRRRPERFLYVGHVTAAGAGPPPALRPGPARRPAALADAAAGGTDRVRIGIRCALPGPVRAGDRRGARGCPPGHRYPLAAAHRARPELPRQRHRHPVTDAVLAVDAAHDAPDPVVAFSSWQRERLAAWRASRALADSPVVWGSLITFTTA